MLLLLKFDLASDYEGLVKQNRLTPELMAEDILKKLEKNV